MKVDGAFENVYQDDQSDANERVMPRYNISSTCRTLPQCNG